MLRRYVFGESLLNDVEVVGSFKCEDNKEYVYPSKEVFNCVEQKHTENCLLCQMENSQQSAQRTVFLCGKYWRNFSLCVSKLTLNSEIDFHETCCHMCQSIRYQALCM